MALSIARWKGLFTTNLEPQPAAMEPKRLKRNPSKTALAQNWPKMAILWYHPSRSRTTEETHTKVVKVKDSPTKTLRNSRISAFRYNLGRNRFIFESFTPCLLYTSPSPRD